MKQKAITTTVACALSLIATGNVLAHATFVAKDTYLTTDGRSYREGTSAELTLNLAHGCGADTATVISTVAFPNGGEGPDEVYDLTLDTSKSSLPLLTDPVPSGLSLSDVLVSGATLSRIKPRVDGDWEEIVPKGANGNVHSIHWHHGWVPDNFYERVNFNASFGKFQPSSCVTKVRIYMPATQYCKAVSDAGGGVVGTDYWLWRPIPELGIGDIGQAPAPGFTVANRAPYVDIDRDLVNNPLPADCSTHKGKASKYAARVSSRVVGVYPSVESIGHYLLHGGATGGGSLICDNGSPANPPDHTEHHSYWCTDGSTPHAP
jgi:hypothetical protein